MEGKRVVQLTFDLLVDEQVDGCILAQELRTFIEDHKRVHEVVGADFSADLTDYYKEIL